MPEFRDLILGFDPGGKGNFGWSVCRVVDDSLQPPASTGLADQAWDAVAQTKRAIETGFGAGDARVLAAGIDAPLFWTMQGGRTADDAVRQALKETGIPSQRLGGRVQHFNSLQGSCVVQGVLLAKLLHDTWTLKITEAHPKALRRLLEHSEHSEITVMVEMLTADLNEHRLDATLAAVTAWAMHVRQPGWRDISRQEHHPVQPFDTPVSYWMPIP